MHVVNQGPRYVADAHFTIDSKVLMKKVLADKIIFMPAIVQGVRFNIMHERGISNGKPVADAEFLLRYKDPEDNEVEHSDWVNQSLVVSPGDV